MFLASKFLSFAIQPLAWVVADGLTEADRAKIFFDSMGVAPQRVIYESASHTTYENNLSQSGLERHALSGGLPHRQQHTVDAIFTGAWRQKVASGLARAGGPAGLSACRAGLVRALP
jgi:hypothetical protein